MDNNIGNSEFVYKNLKRNSFICTLNSCLGSLGGGLVPLGTMLTYYIANYTTSNFYIGLVNFIAPLLSNVPQIFFARYLSKFKYNKWAIVINGLLTRSVWLILGYITISVHNNLVNLMAFLVIYGIVNLGAGVNTLCWNDTMAKVVPLDVRGRFVGIRYFLGGVCEFLATLLMGFLLNRYVFPNNYAVIFVLSGVLTVIAALVFIYINEPPKVYCENSVPLIEYLKQLRGILKTDKNFTSFIVFDYFAILSRSIAAFLIVYAKMKLNLTPGDMVTMTAVLTVSQTFFYLVWGYIDDKYGYRPSLLLSTLGFTMTNLVAFLFLKNIGILLVLYAIIGASQSARNAGRINLTIELAGENDVRTYIALSNFLLTIPFGVFPLLCGVLIDNFGYVPFFIINIVSGIIGMYIMTYNIKQTKDFNVAKEV